MTEKDITAMILQKKINLVREDGLGQVMKEYFLPSFCSRSAQYTLRRQNLLLSMLDSLIGNQTSEIITDDSMKKGLAIYAVTVFCSNTQKQLFVFFSDLVSRETPASIILATVNTIKSSYRRDYSDKLLLNMFYETLNLNYGKILLATSSMEYIKTMKDYDFPFFTNNTTMIDDCLRGGQCLSAIELKQTISI